MTILATRPARPGHATTSLRAPGLDWLLMFAAAALLTLGTLLVWSATSTRADLTGGDPNAGGAPDVNKSHGTVGTGGAVNTGGAPDLKKSLPKSSSK